MADTHTTEVTVVTKINGKEFGRAEYSVDEDISDDPLETKIEEIMNKFQGALMYLTEKLVLIMLDPEESKKYLGPDH